VKLELAKDEPMKVQPKAAATPAPAPAAEPASVTQPLAALALLESPPEQPMQPQPTQLVLLGGDPQPAKDDSLQLELLPEPVRQSG
jgi:hypothetical protein